MEAQNLIDLIDAADNGGRYRFTTNLNRFSLMYPEVDLLGPKVDIVRGMVDQEFFDHHLFKLRLERVKKWTFDIDAVNHSGPVGHESWAISLDLPKMLLLPGIHPKEELSDLRGLLVGLKPFFEDNTTRQSTFRIVNDHKNNVVTAGFTCRHSSIEDSPDSFKHQGKMLDDKPHSARMESIVNDSSALQFFMKQVALELQKIGPYSWFNFTEDHIYGEQKGPRYLARAARLDEGRRSPRMRE